MEELVKEGKKFCIKCGTDNPSENDKKKVWRRHMCHKCYNKYISNPKCSAIYGPRRINPAGRGHIHLKECPRKGVCEWCRRKIGDEYINTQGKIAKIRLTNIHHIEYHEDVLKDTVELCNSCHTKESIRLRKLGNKDNRDPKTGRFYKR